MKLHAWALKNKFTGDFAKVDGLLGLFPTRQDGRFFKKGDEKVIPVIVEIKEAA